MKKSAHQAFQSIEHDHHACINSALNVADLICVKNDARFTPIRKRILELIWQSHKPILAYDILKILRREKENTEPPTVYRGLDFLLEQKLIHKIESRNAYVGCSFANRPHIGQFLICTGCDQFIELDSASINRTILNEASKSNFKIDHQTVEISGYCPECQ